MKKLADDCFVHDKDRMKHAEAIALLRERMAPMATTETMALEEASGRILANDVTAPRNIPAFDNTAVDGYAFAHADHEPTGGFFPIATRIAAGETSDIELPGFSAARIFTGARMPEGADTIAMQEDCETHEQDGTSFVVIPGGLKKGANCRLAGEDVKTGDMVCEAGSRLRPQYLAAIASTGAATVSVFKPLRIGLISSGDEILRPGETYETGKVYDSNTFMLRALLAELGAETTDLGVCPDEAGELETLLQKAASDHDVIISTGGASKGEEDHFVNSLEKLGKCHLWQLAVKPGRPMSFGQIGDTPCFTLPGNPVAAFVCFLLYVRPSLDVLAGGTWREPQRYPLPAGFSIKSKPDRREFLRGFMGKDQSDNTVAKKFERDGSGLITGLRAASGLIEIAEDRTDVSEGDLVDFIPFSEFGII
ncbi:MAG: gephyrin-like molybdotransferase Glp [Pseudomonadota bacterium]